MGRKRLLIGCIASALLLLPASSFAAEGQAAADATLKLSAKSIGIGVGATRGEGTLSYKGYEIPVKYSGMSLGEIGIKSVKLDGDVKNLSFLEKFDGCYATKEIDATLLTGKEQRVLTNDAGVVLELAEDSSGLNLAISKGCAQMKMDPNKLAEVLAALKAQPVKASYQASVYFKTDSSTVTNKQKEELQDVIAILKKKPGTEVIVSGYTDTTGTVEYNDTLSQKRADAVLSTLKEMAQDTSIVNMPPKRVEAIGKGEAPGPKNTPDQLNRRVDILIVKNVQQG